MTRLRTSAPDAPPIHLELDHVGYTTIEGVRLLDAVSLTITAGEAVLLMGPSGSGKTLLTKVLGSVLPPTEGRVIYEGQPLESMSDQVLEKRRLRAGFVFQDAALWQNLSVEQNLALPVLHHYPKTKPADITARIESLCSRLDFTEDLRQRPALLSIGERKVASIIRALMLEPEVVFMDEPSSGLDGSTVQRLLTLLRELRQDGCTLVIASHDSRIASMLGDRIIVVDRGRVTADGTPAELSRSADARILEILSEVMDVSTTWDNDILDMLGSGDESLL